MKILILEDDKKLCDLVVSYLSEELLVDYAHTVDDFKAYLEQYIYDAILLDRNINDVDVGLTLIKMIKEKNPKTAVIVISAYGSVSDKIDGLNLGADDYLDKPFDNEELLARIYAQVRRQVGDKNLEFNGLVFDLHTHAVKYEEKNIDLTKKESELLFYLLKNLNKIISSDELMNAIYLHPEEISSSTIRVTIGNIRKKLPIDIINTIKTRGYIIEKI